MKLFTRFKIFGKEKLEKAMPVSDSSQLKYLLEEKQKILKDSQQKFYNSKGREDYYEEEIQNNSKLLEKIIASAKQVKEDGGDESPDMKRLFDLKNSTTAKIKTYKDCLTKQVEITSQLQKLILKIEKEVTDIKCNLELLKTKEEFSDCVKDLREVSNGKEDVDLDEVLKNIEINFNAQSYALEDMSQEPIDNSDYENFVESL